MRNAILAALILAVIVAGCLVAPRAVEKRPDWVFAGSMVGVTLWFVDRRFKRLAKQIESLEREIQAMRLAKSGEVVMAEIEDPDRG